MQAPGRVWSSERRRQAVEGIREKYGSRSAKPACRIVGQHRGSQRYTTIVRADEDALTRAIVSLALNSGHSSRRRLRQLCASRRHLIRFGSGLGRMTASVRFTLSALRPSSRSHAPPHKPDTRAHERNQDRSIESMEDRPQCRIAIPAYSELGACITEQITPNP